MCPYVGLFFYMYACIHMIMHFRLVILAGTSLVMRSQPARRPSDSISLDPLLTESDPRGRLRFLLERCQLIVFFITEYSFIAILDYSKIISFTRTGLLCSFFYFLTNSIVLIAPKLVFMLRELPGVAWGSVNITCQRRS